MDDPHYLSVHKWCAAIERWFERDGSAVSKLVRDNSEPIPDFAREFLSDLAAGLPRGKGGRPEKRFGEVDRAIVFEVFTCWKTTTKEVAIATVEAKRNMTEGKVRGIVNKLYKQGITRKRWQAWGCPDWSIKKPS